jgi:Fic family protein
MLPIFDAKNAGSTWAVRIAKLQQRLAPVEQTAAIINRVREMFAQSEQGLSESPPAYEALLASFDLLNDRTLSANALTAEFLFKFQDTLQINRGLRLQPMEGQVPGHNPAKPQALATLLETTLDWFGAESFRELHPIEQAVLVHARFLDLQFFPTENTRLSRFAADFCLIRAGLPPIIISGETNRYKGALHQALMMNTQALIDLIAEATERTLIKLTEEDPEGEKGRPGEVEKKIR